MAQNEPSMLLTDLSLAGERILLLGGAGFIGHHLALELRARGAEVMIVDHLQINNLVSIATRSDIDPVRRQLYYNFILRRFELLRAAGVEMRTIDARQMYELSEVFNDFQPSKAVHLAAISSAVTANKVPALAYDLQITTLRNLLELCRLRQSQVGQIVFMSSSTVYGDFEGDEVDEVVRPSPRGVYANGKYVGERMMREHERMFGTSYTIIRPSALYGIRCVSQRVSQKFIENALTGQPLLLEGGGSGLLDFTHIDDLVEGIVRGLALSGGRGTTFNITYGNSRTIADLAAIVKEIVPEVVLEDRPAAPEKPKRGTLRIDRARKLLGFEPKVTLDQGYRRYCQWYVEQWRQAEKMVRQG